MSRLAEELAEKYGDRFRQNDWGSPVIVAAIQEAIERCAKEAECVGNEQHPSREPVLVAKSIADSIRAL